MRSLAVCLLIACVASAGQASDLVKVPAGKIEAIWLRPLNKKDAKKETAIFVAVDSFQVMRYPVTVQEFKTFIKKNPKWAKANASALFVDQHYLHDFEKAKGSSPITFVTWYSARSYCKSMGMRLPTVNEWEYMAAASERKPDANRDSQFLKRILEWYGEPQEGQLKPVGSIYKNMYGIWDMHGLIWEWVEDFNSSFMTGESREDGSLNKDMFCGAGAMSSGDKENYAAFMRFAFRSGLKGKSSVWNLGFRCVK